MKNPLNDWQQIPFQEFAAFNPRESLQKGQVAKHVGMENIQPFTRKVPVYSEKAFGGGSKFVNGDTLLARITPCLENGKTAQVDFLMSGEVGFGSTEFIVLREKQNVSDNNFLFYFSISPRFRSEAIKSMSGTSGRQRVQTDSIAKTEFAFPALKEQKAIAAVLTSLDDKIELLREQNKTLAAIAQALFKHWFVDFEFPNEKGKPYKSSDGKMANSEFGQIPNGWKIGELQDLVENTIDNRGKTPLTSNTPTNYPLIEGQNITSDNPFPVLVEFPKQKFVEESIYLNWFRGGHPRAYDILCATVGTLPKWCFAGERNLCIAQNIIAIRAKREIASPFFLKTLLNSPRFISDFNGRLITAVQPSIKVGHMMTIPIVIPEKKAIEKFDIVSHSFAKKISNNFNQVQILFSLRNFLLPKLMKGEIRIEHNEV